MSGAPTTNGPTRAPVPQTITAQASSTCSPVVVGPVRCPDGGKRRVRGSFKNEQIIGAMVFFLSGLLVLLAPRPPNGGPGASWAAVL